MLAAATGPSALECPPQRHEVVHVVQVWDVAKPAVETTCTVTSPTHMAATVNVRATVNKTTSPNTPADLYTYG